MKKIIITLAIFSFCSILFGEAPVVIANNDVTAASLDSAAISKIFLGKKQKWDDGKKIKPVTLKGGAVHDAFLKTHVNKTASQFTTFWKKIIFAGMGVPPKSFKTEAEVVAYVAKTPGAVGYVSAAAEGVKTIAVK